MGFMIVRLRTKDFFDWRKAFNNGQPDRAAAGLTNERFYRSDQDGNDIVIVMDVEDLQKAKDFSRSAVRKAAMRKAEVIGEPIDHFVGFDCSGDKERA